MEHERIVVLSDVHGFVEPVQRMVDYYDNDVHYVFNGDCVDRGPDSKGVLDIIQETGADLILGNHEWVLLAALTERESSRKWGWYEAWLGNGPRWGYEKVMSWHHTVKNDVPTQLKPLIIYARLCRRLDILPCSKRQNCITKVMNC
jgi:serine/threonine protein phosphatase 1